jgi:hypothetical protein
LLIIWRGIMRYLSDKMLVWLQGTLHFFRSDLIFCHLSTHPKTHTQTMAHHLHHPPLSRWRKQRQQHGNDGDKEDNMVTLVTARRQQHDSRAVAEGITQR